MAKVIENTDHLNPELRGLIDFSTLSTGGMSIQPISEREFKSDAEGIAAYEKFMAEPVVIKIHATADKNEPPFADLGLHGVPCPVPRERPVRIPRAYLEVLARSQVRVYSQERNPNPDASEGMKTHRKTGASFPFQILEDKNPKGPAWLRRIMYESA